MEIIRRIDLIENVDKRLEELKVFEDHAAAAEEAADFVVGGDGGGARELAEKSLADKKSAVKTLLKKDSFDEADVLKVTEYVTDAINKMLSGNEDELIEGVDDAEKAELVSHFARSGPLTKHLIRNLTSKDESKKLMQELVTYVEALEKLEDIKLKTSCLRRFPNSLEKRVYDACTQTIIEELESTLCNMNPASDDKALLRRAHDLVMSDYYDIIAAPIRASGRTPDDHTLTTINWMVGRTDFKAKHTTHLYQKIGGHNLNLKWDFYREYQNRLKEKITEIKQKDIAELVRFIKARNISDDKGPLNYSDNGDIYRNRGEKLYKQMDDGSFLEVTKRTPDNPEEFYYTDGGRKIFVKKSEVVTRQVPTFNPRTIAFENKKKHFFRTASGEEKECSSQLTPRGYYYKDASGNWVYQTSRIYSAPEALTEKLRSMGIIAPTAEVSGEFLSRATLPPNNLVWASEADLEYEIRKCFFPPLAIGGTEGLSDMEKPILTCSLDESKEFLIKSLKSPNQDEKIAAVHNLFISYFGSYPEKKESYRNFLYNLGYSLLSEEERIRYIKDGDFESVIAQSAAKAQEFIASFDQVEHGIPQFMLTKLKGEAANMGVSSDNERERLEKLGSTEKRLEFFVDKCIENHDSAKLEEILSNKPLRVEYTPPVGILAGPDGRRGRTVVENLQINPNVLHSVILKKAQRGSNSFDEEDLRKEDLMCWHYINKTGDTTLPSLIDFCITNFKDLSGVENLLFLFKNSDDATKEEIKTKLAEKRFENNFLFPAIFNNMASIMPYLVHDGNVNIIPPRRPTFPLMCAIENYAFETVASLLKLNADPNLVIYSRGNERALFTHMVNEGRLDIANLLLESDKINLHKCFVFSARDKNHDAMNMVLGKVMDVAEKDDSGSNFLHYACLAGPKIGISILLKEKAAEFDDDAFKKFVNEVDGNGKTPLNLLLERKTFEADRKESLILLLNSEANPYLCLEHILKKTQETRDFARCKAEVSELFRAIEESNIEFKKDEYLKVQEKYPDVSIEPQFLEFFGELEDLKNPFKERNLAACTSISDRALLKYGKNLCDFIARDTTIPDDFLYPVLDRLKAINPEMALGAINETFNDSTLLFSAIRTDKVSLFFKLIDDYGANINGRNGGGTPLHYLATYDSDSKKIMFEEFVARFGPNRGSVVLDLDAINSSGGTPLQSALMVGNRDAALTLLNAGANPCATLRQILKNDGEGYLIPKLIELIKENSPQLKDLLKVCLEEENVKKPESAGAVDWILSRATNPDSRRDLCLPKADGKYYPLRTAIRSGNNQMVDAILKHCPEAANVGFKKSTPLSLAIEENAPVAAEALLNSGAAIGENLAFAAIFSRDEDPVFEAMIRRATPQEMIYNVNSSIELGQKELLLITRKITNYAQRQIPKNMPVLQEAINTSLFIGNYEMTAAILQNISNPSIKSAILNPPLDKPIPLHLAVGRRDGAAVIETLLQNGANIDYCDIQGKSALWHAMSDKSLKLEAVSLLIKQGAKTSFPAGKEEEGENLTVNFCYKALAERISPKNINLFNKLIIENHDETSHNSVNMIQKLFLTAIENNNPQITVFLFDNYSKNTLSTLPQEKLYQAIDKAMQKPTVDENNLVRILDILKPEEAFAVAAAESPKLCLDLGCKNDQGENLLGKAIEYNKCQIARNLAARPDQPRKATLPIEALEKNYELIDEIERRGIKISYHRLPRGVGVTPRDVAIGLASARGQGATY